MKENSVKLSGHAKDRFLERFFAEDTDLAPGTRQRLVARARSAFSSLRVRKAVLAAHRKSKPAKAARTSDVQPNVPVPQPPATAAAAPDPFAVKLVPVFQREGRDGLLAQLARVADVDHLRQMAKAQQIILPPDLRTGTVDAAAIRDAIADAVAKRIADRRAAAG